MDHTYYDMFGRTYQSNQRGSKQSLSNELNWLKRADNVAVNEDYIADAIFKWLKTTTTHGYIHDQIKKQTGINFWYTNVVWDENSHGDVEIRSSTVDEFIEDAEESLTKMLCKAAPREKRGSTNHTEAKPGEEGDPIYNAGDILYTKKVPIKAVVCDKKGKKRLRDCYLVEMYFNPEILERKSITGKPEEKLENIIHLYQTGIRKNTKKYVYGYWGDALEKHEKYKTTGGYVAHRTVTRDANGHISGRIDPKGEDPRMKVYNFKKNNSRSNNFDFLEDVVHRFNIYNANRAGAFAKVTGTYVLSDSKELTWEEVTREYKRTYPGHNRENRADKKKEAILHLSRK